MAEFTQDELRRWLTAMTVSGLVTEHAKARALLAEFDRLRRVEQESPARKVVAAWAALPTEARTQIDDRYLDLADALYSLAAHLHEDGRVRQLAGWTDRMEGS